MITAPVLLDFTKAFDTEFFLGKFKFVGLKNLSVKLTKSFLCDRTQSDTRSVLRPILFSIFISQLSRFIGKKSLHMFVDDTQLYYHFCPVTSQLLTKS